MSTNLLTALSLPELEAQEFPPIEWLVEDIIPAGALVLAVGRPKAGKSLLLGIDLCACVALGERFLDKTTTQGSVLYFPAEDALRLVRSRFWTRLGDERAAPLYVVPVDGSLDQTLRLDVAESFLRFAGTIEHHRPELAVLDPFRELHTKKENDADEMAALMRPLRQLAHDTNTTIVLIHHRNKYAHDAGAASRGSNAIPAGADVVITLDPPKDDTDELAPDDVVRVRVEGRYGPRQRFGARIGTGLHWEATDPRLATDLSVAERIRRELDVSEWPMTADQLAEKTGAKKKSVQNDLSDLFTAGAVRRFGAGTKSDPFRYHGIAGNTRGTNVSASGQTKPMMVPHSQEYSPHEGGNHRECPKCGYPGIGKGQGGRLYCRRPSCAHVIEEVA